jgi:hypothetical protein
MAADRPRLCAVRHAADTSGRPTLTALPLTALNRHRRAASRP